MSKIIFGIALIFFAGSVITIIFNRNRVAAKKEVKETTSISIPKSLIDIGDVKKGESAEAKYIIYNTGNNDLTIESVLPDCHCTVASFDKKPVHAGDSTSVILKYNPTIPGLFQASATLNSNSTTSATVLIFRGNIVDSSMISTKP